MSRRQEITRAQLKARLTANREDLDRVDQQQAKLRAERAELIRAARAAGLGVTELTRLTGLTRRGVYDVLGAD